MIEVNPNATQLADKADQERKEYCEKNGGGFGALVGLHGIPVLLKDNIGTKDKLNNTAWSYALMGSKVPRDAGWVGKLRKAGAIVLGKASLSEWSRFRSLSGILNGWLGRAGQGMLSCLCPSLRPLMALPSLIFNQNLKENYLIEV